MTTDRMYTPHLYCALDRVFAFDLAEVAVGIECIPINSAALR